MLQVIIQSFVKDRKKTFDFSSNPFNNSYFSQEPAEKTQPPQAPIRAVNGSGYKGITIQDVPKNTPPEGSDVELASKPTKQSETKQPDPVKITYNM